MIIDERQAGDLSIGVDAKLIAKLIKRHELEHGRYDMLLDYYKGKHAINNRQRCSDGLPNNKVVCNHAKYITDMTTSYIIGNAVTYSPAEEYDIEPLKNAYLEQDISSLDYELVKAASIYGRAYELIYSDEQSKPRSAFLPPQQAFVVYNDDCTRLPLFGVYYYKTRDIDGAVTGLVCNVYTDERSFAYEAQSDNWDALQLTAEAEHYFGKVPLIEYENNKETQGDYEQLIAAIDAYNTLMSDRVNDKEQFVDAFLFLINIDLDSELAKKLKAERILLATDEKAKAEYLSKVLSESDMQVLRDNLKEDIHRFSMVPDLSDESFGNNLSGVAIRYKLLGFEQATKSKERNIAKSLKQRFELYNIFLANKREMKEVPIHRVDVKFTHNLPANNLEMSQMIANLKGTVTDETLLDQLDFVADPKEEAELMRKEQEEKQKAVVMAAASYGATPQYNYDEE